MPVGPADAKGVVARKLDGARVDVVRDRRRIKQPFARQFADARRTRTVAAHRRKAEPVGPSVGPVDHELAARAVEERLPAELPLRAGNDDDLVGQNLPRLDVPAKVDGSANFAADIRLPDMVFASIRQGPLGELAPQGGR